MTLTSRFWLSDNKAFGNSAKKAGDRACLTEG